jgi:glutathione synthase
MHAVIGQCTHSCEPTTLFTSLFIIDPPDRLDPATDTSLALMRSSVARDHRVFFATLDGLRLTGSHVEFTVHPVSFAPHRELFEAGEERLLDGAECDVVYMRKDPPVDAAYLHAALILERLPETVLQINPARALRRYCEKLIPLELPGLLPPTLMTRNPADLARFLHMKDHIVVKPMDDCSGRGILSVRRGDADIDRVFAQATACGTRFVQGQQYLPEISDGDKRVLLLGGEILGWVRRVPAPGDFRSNVNAGGHCVTCDLTDEDRAICNRLGTWLRQHDIHLAGVDIVGAHVLEVNITSPSCLREMNALTNQHLEHRVVDYAESASRRLTQH